MNKKQTERLEALLEKLTSLFQADSVTVAEALTVLLVFVAMLEVRFSFDAFPILETARENVKRLEPRATVH